MYKRQGLYADGKTSVTEPALSRNHTELMLRSFGVKVESHDTTATFTPPEEMIATDIVVPGDISSATFFIVAGLITPNSCIRLKNVGINPTRDGILRVCKDMGADVTLENVIDNGGEPTADIVVKTSKLKAVSYTHLSRMSEGRTTKSDLSWSGRKKWKRSSSGYSKDHSFWWSWDERRRRICAS